MATGQSLPDLPPYHLQHLVSNVKELLGGSSPGRPSSRADRGPVEVRCAQALGSELYVGCSDGSILRYAFVDSLGSSAESYQLLTHQALPSGHAIEQIVLAPSVEKALVLCDHQIYFFTLPNLEPLDQLMKPIRNVVTYALDDTHQQRKPPADRRSQPPDVVTVCVLKRSSIVVYSLGLRLQFRKEIPLPNGATLGRLSNKHLCIADHDTYNVIDLESASLIPLLPLSQVDSSPVKSPVKPSITVIGESEFLLLSWTGSSTLGVFITGTGDPVRGTLTWNMHPTALCCDYPYVTSLLPNGNIEVHELETQALRQILSSTSAISPIALGKSTHGFVVPRDNQKHTLDLVDFPLLEPAAPNTSEIEERAAVGGQSNSQTPTSGDATPTSSSTTKHRTRQSKASILAVCTDAIYALAVPTLIQQIDTLVNAHKLNEATNLAKEQQRKLEQRKRASHSHSAGELEAQSEEVSYVYQRLGYKYLSETSFEDAGINLFRGNVDPRLLVRLFPSLRGTLLSPSISLPVFYGLESQLRSLNSVDTIIVTNLVKNYTPHLQPNTRSAPPTSELRKLLVVSARDMLREYLRKWKNKVLYSGEPVIKETSQVIDTVMVKLLAESEDTQELYSLLDSSEDIVVEEVEETLVRTGQYHALVKIYRKRNETGKLLNVLSKLVDGEWTDEDIQDPLAQMMALLNETRDRMLIQRWGLWLIKQDASAGLKLLMSGDGKRSTKTDDSVLLSQIEAVDAQAGQQFLEYLVLHKHSNDPGLHTRLAEGYIDQLNLALQTGEVLEFFKDSAFEYSIQNSTITFLTHLVTTVDASSPLYEHVRTRCRAALFLQGSKFYDERAMLDKLTPWADILGFEVAILDGKLGKHTDALKALVHTLRDTASADAYCALGGCAVSPKVAQLVGERLGLQAWAALVVGGTSGNGSSSRGSARNNVNLEEKRGELLQVLLKVYMSGGEATEGHTARLLNSQGGKLDVSDVLSLVPAGWPLNVVSSFLARSLRQSVHEKCEGEIFKAVCLGQNLEVRDEAYTLTRNQGAFIQEPVEGAQSGAPPYEQENALLEKEMVILDEKKVEDITPQDLEKQRPRHGEQGIDGAI
ncbi:hypothetical protein JB92DRAFT_3099258 [Gautieria morchelliformis]|nr:hypothetical protein JB92DRAFT_3099258 [Gautieria morchelliformis]